MTAFTGFANSAAGTVIPNAFFSRVLPEISDPAELVVSAYVFFALGLRRRQPRFVTLRELEADAGLARALASLCGNNGDALRRGLDLAARRGTLARATMPRPILTPGMDRPEGMSLRIADGEALYTTNMPANVRGLERLASDGVSIEEPP